MTERTHSTRTDIIRVVLVLTLPPASRELTADREQEMRSLLDTAGCEVVAVAHQYLARPAAGTYIGKGKCQEVAALAQEHSADEVVFGVELSPSQERNLEEAIGLKVIDYTALILHIFSRNARTQEAQLAVELAQLEHNRSRLKRLWTHLDRIKAGMNMRGPGEKQLEVDRRLIDTRIRDLKLKLAEIEARKDRSLASRDDCFKVCLVGYTNAGKSSLMNALTDAGVLAEDRLFATLDTRTKQLHLDPRRKVVLSDTVGFIRDLPHKLIASFHATLAEVIHADLLLHVVDSSLPNMEDQMVVVEGVLEHIGAQEVPALMVFNKIDREHSRTILAAFTHRYRGSVAVSARTGAGLEELRAAILAAAEKAIQKVTVRFAIADGATAAFLRRRSTLLEEHYDDTHALWTIESDQRLREELARNPQLELVTETVKPAWL